MAQSPLTVPPSAAPALDFELLLSRDLQDHRPARVTRMVPQEKFTANLSGRPAVVATATTATTRDDKTKIKQQQEQAEQTTRWVRQLVSTTPAFLQHLEQQELAVHQDQNGDDEDATAHEQAKWKAGLEKRTAKLIQELLSKDLDAGSSTAKGAGSKKDNKKLPTAAVPALTEESPYLEPALHEVEMGDWESKIQWDGVPEDVMEITTTDTTTAADTANGNAPTDAMALLKRRRNPLLDTLVFDNNTISWDASPEDLLQKARNIPLILELGVAGQSVARHVFPSQRPMPGVKSEAYQARIEREWKDGTSHMHITSTADVSRVGSLHADREKMEALIEVRQRKRAQMAKDKTSRVTEAMGTLAMGGGKGRTITSSLMGPGGTERTGRPSRHNVTTSAAHELDYIEQLDMITNHSLVRDLSKVSLRQYHRPKLPMTVVRSSLKWQFQIRYIASPGGKKGAAGGSRQGDNASSYQSMMMGTHPGAISKAKLRNESDFSPSEGKLILLEYCEERPPIQLTKGMATKIVNYYRGDKSRCPVSAGGGDRPIRKKKRAETTDTGSANKTKKASEKTNQLLGDRPPRLDGPDKALKASAVDWIGPLPTKTREGDANQKNKPLIDVIPEGVTEMLHPKVHGPFMGEIDEGMTVTGLMSPLFVAPMFRHEPETTDFLMILGRSAGGGVSRPGMTEALGVILRDFPSSVFTVGQQEPRTRVYAPNTQGEKNFLGPFISYQIAKALQKAQARDGHGLRFDEIQDRVMPNLELPANALRQRLKQVALYDKNTQIWTTKPLGYEDYPGVDALGKSIGPEGVAAFETACANTRRLIDLGIHHLFSGAHSVGSVGITMIYLAGQLNASKELHRKAKKMYELSRNNKSLKPSQVMFFERTASELETAWKNLRQKYEVAKFIYEELQLTSWHLTGEFIEVHKKGEGTGMMKLTGIGDPSGMGEGYSFLREMDSKPNKSVGTGALNAQMKKITGTEDDLRKLTMKQMAALLRSYGMAQKQIDTLKRWDRVHVIRDLSTKAASDGIGDGLERFARGEKMKLSEQKEVYRKRIQVIWKRQIAALSSSPDGTGAAGDAGGPESTAAAGPDAVDDTAGAAGGTPKAATASAQKKQDAKGDSDESEDDDDDDFAAAFEEEMMDGSEANQLVAAHARAGGEGGENDREAGLGQLRAAAQDKDLTRDARELAALKRQREEERVAREGMLSADNRTPGTLKENMAMGAVVVNRKVIRKKIVKTFPDGRQTTTFKFIVRPDAVGKELAKMNQKKDEKPKKKNELTKYEYSREERAVGHAMFEDEDDFDYTSKSRYGATKRRGRGRGRGGSPGRAPRGRSLQIGKLKTRITKEDRMKKRKRVEEEADLYTTASKRKGTSNRRERGSIRDRRPHVLYAEKLESIRSMVESRPQSGPFQKPVNRRIYPRYYEVISEPIDLQTIRDKIQRYEYRSAEQFLKDFDLMKQNAIKFNGGGSVIADEAVAIADAVKQEIQANQTELKSMEEAVKEQLSGKPKKKKKKKGVTKKTKKSAGVASGANMGMIGGVAVDLGELPDDFNLNDLPSDSDNSYSNLLDL